MLTRDGQVKVADMGLAKSVTEDSNLTQTGAGMGTPYYMSPEQAEDARTADHRADIYSLGVTLLHILTGKRPYEGDSAYSIILGHAMNPLPTGEELGVKLPDGVEALIQKMAAKSPDERYQDYDNLLADLGKVKSGKSLSVEKRESPPPQPESRKPVEAASPEKADKRASSLRRARTVPARRRRGKGMPALAASAGVALILLVGGIWLAKRSGDEGRDRDRAKATTVSVSHKPSSSPSDEPNSGTEDDDSPDTKEPKPPAPLVIEDPGKLYSGRTLTDWVKLLRSENELIRVSAAKALMEMGRDAKPAEAGLAEALRDPNTQVRTYAVSAVSHIGGSTLAIPALVELVPDEDFRIGDVAMQALAQIGAGAEDAAPALVERLSDGGAAGVHATRALVSIGTEKAVVAVCRALSSGSATARRRAAEVLAQIGPKAEDALPALKKLMDDENEDKQVRAAAAEALLKIQIPEE